MQMTGFKNLLALDSSHFEAGTTGGCLPNMFTPSDFILFLLKYSFIYRVSSMSRLIQFMYIYICFFRVFSIISYYKILNKFSVLYSRSLLFILYIIVCIC